MTDRLPIDQVAKRAHVPASALRYYESVGLLPVAPRLGGRRVYAADVLDRLAVIRVAKEAGFTLAETRRLLRGLGGRKPAADRWKVLARAKMAELDRQLARVTRMRELLVALTRCPCPSLADCGRALGTAVASEGGALRTPPAARRRARS